MDHAIVLACGTGFAGEKLGSYLNKSVAYVPQIKRILINAQRAGINNFTICVESKDPQLEKIVNNDKRIDSNIEWTENGFKSGHSNSGSLIIPSNVLINTASLEEFLKANGHTDSDVTVLTKDKELTENNGNNSDGTGYGIIAASGKDIQRLLENPDLSKWITPLIESGKVDFVSTKSGYWMNLNGNRDSIKVAEDLIFSTVGKTATGWIARNINGRISLPISKHLIKTPLTPNMISILINVIGMLCGPFYALGYPVVGALFMQIATVLDRCDGEVARIKLMETKKGQWVDTLSDQVTVFSFIVGSSLGYYFESDNSLALILGSVNLFIFIFFLVWSLYFIARYTDSGSLVAYFQVDKYVDTDETSIIRKFIALLRPLGRRNVYSLAFLIFAIIGGYPLVVGVLTFALILFFLHQLEDIFKIFKIKGFTRNDDR